LSLQNLPSVSCRPQQIGAVFTNIVDNAIRASEGRGCVTIETLAQNRHVEVRIRDAGKGFIKEALTGIFEPGFREEGGRVSTGNWGLFSARQIIREHAGEIWIESEPEKGTVVTVTLPADAVESWV
jgi:signal transduction histidine kinase